MYPKFPTFIARRKNLVLWSLGDYEYEITKVPEGSVSMKDTSLEEALDYLKMRAAEEEE